MRYITISSLITIILFHTIPVGEIYSQVNTESLRHDVSAGYSGSISFGLDMARGNTDFLKLNGTCRLDYRKNKSHIFSVARYARGEKNRQAYLNKAFAHLRFVRTLSPRLALEFFAQKEYNDFILLKDRQLAGIGGRFILLPTVRSLSSAMGLGLMREHEFYNDEDESESRIWRLTSYLSGGWRHDPRFRLLYAVYYQLNFEDSQDFRILSELQILFDITKTFSVEMLIRHRYDHQPLPDVKHDDFAFTNGIRLSF